MCGSLITRGAFDGATYSSLNVARLQLGGHGCVIPVPRDEGLTSMEGGRLPTGTTMQGGIPIGFYLTIGTCIFETKSEFQCLASNIMSVSLIT